MTSPSNSPAVEEFVEIDLDDLIEVNVIGGTDDYPVVNRAGLIGSIRDLVDAALTSPSPAVEKTEPVAWKFCPECGCSEVRYEEGRHKQCADCGQEWFNNLDYLDVVAKNLGRLTSANARADELALQVETLTKERDEARRELAATVRKFNADNADEFWRNMEARAETNRREGAELAESTLASVREAAARAYELVTHARMELPVPDRITGQQKRAFLSLNEAHELLAALSTPSPQQEGSGK